jgi:Eukaryotic cytochrome b561
MIGSLAIIGIPGQTVGAANPGKYAINQKSLSGVSLLPDAQQTLMDGNIEQNDTHTMLTFTKRLVEPGEISIIADSTTTNNFLAAAGTDIDILGFHVVRGNVGLGLSQCTSEGVAASSVQAAPETDPMKSSFKAHGWMAVIAWGILVPVAIGNSLCRHLIPGKGIWFQAHRALNSMAIALTIISFGVVVNAVQKSSTVPDHFKSDPGALGKHKTIGLVVFLLSLLQGIGGVMRPHLPETEGEKKTSARTVWEFAHKGSGYALLAMAWYQCYTGLANSYLQRFPDSQDYSDVFWGVVGAISGIAIVGALTRFVMPPPVAAPLPKSEDKDDHNDAPSGYVDVASA